ncbi:hypothetical protein ACFL6U_04185 [Planctomycetota bacterium]
MTKYDPHSEFLANEEQRTERFQHNGRLNGLLAELRDLLAPVQDQVNAGFEKPQWPVGLILGSPRSGSTVFLQFLAATGSFAYPTNLLTRFAYAPYIGALIQNMLFDPKYDYQGDFRDIQSEMTFSSDLGKSQGALATNEFFHFWRKYFPNFDPDWLTHAQLITVRLSGCFQSVASIEAVFEKPFVAKGWMFQYNLDFFINKMPPSLFLWVKRGPLFVMQSILWAREQFYDDRNLWLSMKPREYAQLKEMDVYHQVAGQVYFTEKAIEAGLKDVPQANQLLIEYEAFCEDPKTVYKQIVGKYAALGCELPSNFEGPESFECRNEIRLPKDEIEGLQSAYDDFESERIVFS